MVYVLIFFDCNTPPVAVYAGSPAFLSTAPPPSSTLHPLQYDLDGSWGYSPSSSSSQFDSPQYSSYMTLAPQPGFMEPVVGGGFETSDLGGVGDKEGEGDSALLMEMEGQHQQEEKFNTVTMNFFDS
jgi:hypothetical protein